jgi:O-methyltransferase
LHNISTSTVFKATFIFITPKSYFMKLLPFKKKKNLNIKYPGDFEELHISIHSKIKSYTMTSAERVFGLIEAVKYISKNKIEGDVAECGVWKGGSMMAAALTLQKMKDDKRHLYMYDTYEGMSEPTDNDKTFEGVAADKLLKREDREKNASGVWAYSSLPEVKQAMRLTGYDEDLIHYVKGKVEDTIPQTLPASIALLRLDTDWYESTRHELLHLFPLLVKGGVLILDDYGHWKGARKAADEYFNQHNICILLNRMDETGRIAIKQ